METPAKRVWPWLVGFTGLAYLAWGRQELPFVVERTLASLAVLASLIIAAWVCLLSSSRLSPRELHRSWRLLSVALTLWVLSQTVDVCGWIFLKRSLVLPTAKDLLRLAGYLAASAAILSYPASPRERFGRLREFFDMVILSFAVLTLVWLVILRPVQAIGLADSIQIFWLGMGPAFDFVFIVLLFRLGLLSNNKDEATIFWLFCVTFILYAFSNLAFGFLWLPFEIGLSDFTEVGWVVGSLILAVSSQRRFVIPFQSWERGTVEERPKLYPRIEAWLPLLFSTAVVGFAGFSWFFSGEADWQPITASIVLAVLLIARQGVIAGQFEMRQYAALVHASADLAFVCDAEGLLRLANPSLAVSLHRTMTNDQTFHLQDFMRANIEISALLRQGLKEGWEGEVAFLRQDGSTFPVHLSLRPVRDAGQARALLAATAHDLTNVRARENALRQALEDVAAARRDLESLNAELEAKVEARTSELEATIADLARLNEELKALDRMKNEFVALVSHELRAPLTNIRTGIELILDNSAAIDPQSSESLSLVQADIRRLSNFVETILDLSALEAGRFPIDAVPIPIDNIAQSVCRRFLDMDGGRRIKVSFNADLPQVLADEQAIESVFYHLLDNALKYAPQGEVYLHAWDEDGFVLVAVDDGGPGVDAEESERIFEMFHRLDTSDSREVYGYGLGLPMVKRLLEAMGGGIRVEKSARGGARFVFWLPKVAQDDDA